MIKIPEWLAKRSKNSCLDIRDIARALDISLSAARSRCDRGYASFPKPDYNAGVKKGSYADGAHLGCNRSTAKNKWKAATVRNYIRKLNRIELEKPK